MQDASAPTGFSPAGALGTASSSSSGPGSAAGVLEVDAADASDPQCFVDYVNEIHAHYRSVEVKTSERDALPGQSAPARASRDG